MKGIEYLYEYYSSLPSSGSVDNKSIQNLLLYPYFRLKHGKKNDNGIYSQIENTRTIVELKNVVQKNSTH